MPSWDFEFIVTLEAPAGSTAHPNEKSPSGSVVVGNAALAPPRAVRAAATGGDEASVVFT